MKLPKTFLPLFLILVVLLVSGFYLGNVLTQKGKVGEQGLRPGETPRPRQRQVDDTSFDSTQYVIPLESNEAGSIYSSRAQVRGVVSSWGGKILAVKVGEKAVNISLPSQVYLRCMSATVTGPNGEVVKTSSVYLDFRNAETKGTLVDTSIVSEKIAVGADITVQVNVDENDNMTADMIVGYGCTI